VYGGKVLNVASLTHSSRSIIFSTDQVVTHGDPFRNEQCLPIFPVGSSCRALSGGLYALQAPRKIETQSKEQDVE
jgi:hypothetical protein